mgnify:CR=1 FL=1
MLEFQKGTPRVNKELEWGQVECCSDSMIYFIREEQAYLGPSREPPCKIQGGLDSEQDRARQVT